MLEAVEHAALRNGVPVDARVESGRTPIHALQRLWSVEDFDRRKDQRFWRGLVDSIPAWDRLIDEFNAEVGGAALPQTSLAAQERS